MITLLAVALVTGCAIAVYWFPQYWLAVPSITATLVLLKMLMVVRRLIAARGGTRLWLQWVRLQLRPAVRAKAKQRKGEAIVRLSADIDRVHAQRRRQTDQARQMLLPGEVRRIGTALSGLRKRYAGRAFVDFHFLDNGACFCITDDQPYPHQDLYAILAEVQDHRHWRRKVLYSVRKGQMLEDKEVFPAHVSPPQFTSLRKARRVLNKTLRAVVAQRVARAAGKRTG